MPWAGNIVKTMMSNWKQFTVARELLTAVAHDPRWHDVVTGISAHFSIFFFASCFFIYKIFTHNAYNTSIYTLKYTHAILTTLHYWYLHYFQYIYLQCFFNFSTLIVETLTAGKKFCRLHCFNTALYITLTCTYTIITFYTMFKLLLTCTTYSTYITIQLH